jgi:hypothetical protein
VGIFLTEFIESMINSDYFPNKIVPLLDVLVMAAECILFPAGTEFLIITSPLIG